MIVQEELESLEALWETGLEAAFRDYTGATGNVAPENRERVALAAALVEVALRLQRLGGRAATPADLLRGDLCLARASRLLADARDQRLQIGFARTIEDSSAEAASGRAVGAIRPRLRALITGDGG